MKTFKLSISSRLQKVTIKVSNGSAFEKALITGEFKRFRFETTPEDLNRIVQYLKEYGETEEFDGYFAGSCAGHSMELFCKLSSAENMLEINTYRPFSRENNKPIRLQHAIDAGIVSAVEKEGLNVSECTNIINDTMKDRTIYYLTTKEGHLLVAIKKGMDVKIMDL